MRPLQQSVEPLRQYLATYEIYLDFLRLDVDAYVSQAEDDLWGPAAGVVRGRAQRTEQARLERERVETDGRGTSPGKTVGRGSCPGGN